MKTDYPDIFMHPTELMKTPFGRVCLVKPYEYSSMDDPIDKLSTTVHEVASLHVQFEIDVATDHNEYSVEPYLSGIIDLYEKVLNNFGRILLFSVVRIIDIFPGILAKVTKAGLVLPCSYKEVVLAQFFLEQICKVRF